MRGRLWLWGLALLSVCAVEAVRNTRTSCPPCPGGPSLLELETLCPCMRRPILPRCHRDCDDESRDDDVCGGCPKKRECPKKCECNCPRQRSCDSSSDSSFREVDRYPLGQDAAPSFPYASQSSSGSSMNADSGDARKHVELQKRILALSSQIDEIQGICRGSEIQKVVNSLEALKLAHRDLIGGDLDRKAHQEYMSEKKSIDTQVASQQRQITSFQSDQTLAVQGTTSDMESRLEAEMKASERDIAEKERLLREESRRVQELHRRSQRALQSKLQDQISSAQDAMEEAQDKLEELNSKAGAITPAGGAGAQCAGLMCALAASAAGNMGNGFASGAPSTIAVITPPMQPPPPQPIIQFPSFPQPQPTAAGPLPYAAQPELPQYDVNLDNEPPGSINLGVPGSESSGSSSSGSSSSSMSSSSSESSSPGPAISLSSGSSSSGSSSGSSSSSSSGSSGSSESSAASGSSSRGSSSSLSSLSASLSALSSSSSGSGSSSSLSSSSGSSSSSSGSSASL